MLREVKPAPQPQPMLAVDLQQLPVLATDPQRRMPRETRGRRRNAHAELMPRALSDEVRKAPSSPWSWPRNGRQAEAIPADAAGFCALPGNAHSAPQRKAATCLQCRHPRVFLSHRC
mmetsp:Transcript_72272/g.200483  ORF Transcript_72272/g.200483 Transcript_72272/m.200483 type:complete len:117 (-) Transcript_72272:529-879(-)